MLGLTFEASDGPNAAHERLGEPAWSAVRSEGRAMSFEEAVAHALEGKDPTQTSAWLRDRP
ncbi:MAG TPA: hypothetical protein VGR18_04990 [Rubrobacter sp.]|nr:hypothetical protein [Rubrobacter sp.]